MLRRLGIATLAVAWLASGLGPAAAGSIVPLEGAVARYHHRVIGLGDGWDGASICAVYTAVDIRCYDTDAEFRADAEPVTLPGQMTAQAMSDCAYGWACLWEHINWGGRRLQFREAGSTQGLSAYDFRDKTSALWNNMPAGKYFDVIDYRTGMSDPYIVAVWGDYSSDLRQISYPGGIYGGGNWNDKADGVRVRQG